MDSILSGYQVNPPTWFYLSLLLILSVFFRFNRFWSLRNLDLALLLSIAPGLLLISHGQSVGYVWLFVITGCLLLRCQFDGSFTRRPRLPQNMNAAGLTFLCVAAFAFLMTKVLTEDPSESTLAEVKKASQLLAGGKGGEEDVPGEAGPSSRILIAAFAVAPSQAVVTQEGKRPTQSALELIAARMISIVAHLAVMAGLVLVAHWHFGDIQLGLAMATLYMLLPCTSYDVGRVTHVLPAALVVWGCALYRRPMWAGIFLGLACGTLFFPVFLIPVWTAFYWKRGVGGFLSAIGLTMACLLVPLALTTPDITTFTQQVFGRIDWTSLQFREFEGNGFWSIYPSAYRIPVFVTFLAMIGTQILWPREKTFADLLSHSAAIVVGTQFWYPEQGGAYILWYLPLVLMVVFRPTMSIRPLDFRPHMTTSRIEQPRQEAPASTNRALHSLLP